MSGSCFFIGHREADGRIWSSLVDAVNRHITEYGVTDFTVGRYGGFDALASKAVLAAKEEYPEVRLTLLLPYHPFDRPFKLPEGFDGSFYPPGMETVPHRAAIVRANRYMVDHCDHLIAYAWHPASNARDLLDYARAREKRGLIHVTTIPRGGEDEKK